MFPFWKASERSLLKDNEEVKPTALGGGGGGWMTEYVLALQGMHLTDMSAHHIRFVIVRVFIK